MQGSVAYTDEAKVMWDKLKETFSQGNGPCIHEIKIEIGLLQQGGLAVVESYTKLKVLG